MTDAKTCARCAGAGVLVIDFVDGHCPDCEDGYEVPFNRLTDLGQALRQRDEALAELRASQAECERLRERGAEWRKERDEAIQANCAARAQLAEARHHANHCTDCCGLIFDLVKP